MILIIWTIIGNFIAKMKCIILYLVMMTSSSTCVCQIYIKIVVFSHNKLGLKYILREPSNASPGNCHQLTHRFSRQRPLTGTLLLSATLLPATGSNWYIASPGNASPGNWHQLLHHFSRQRFSRHLIPTGTGGAASSGNSFSPSPGIWHQLAQVHALLTSSAATVCYE